MLMFHNKTDRVSRFPATETFVNSFCRRNSKRRRFFIVKRAARLVIAAGAGEPADGSLHDIEDIVRIAHAALEVVVEHCRSFFHF